MDLEIKINLDNDAYQDTLGWELGENLQYVIERIGHGIKESVIQDTNGNTVGHWSIKDQETEEFIRDHFQFIRVGD